MSLTQMNVLPACTLVHKRATQPKLTAQPARSVGTHRRHRCVLVQNKASFVEFSFDQPKKSNSQTKVSSHGSLGCPDSSTGFCPTINKPHEKSRGFTLTRDRDPTGCPESETGFCEFDDGKDNN
uniref:Uncharacterized protein n=1 Tax=Pyramimonas obovata TaxID=1411642 RepID=A0A7S0RWF1_9CHLO|mmetsp:Transcript_8166/g.16805  ORF Transcript_8166/g.16805 Transcript_8166/m.16805 type:complete len:124 (+) Transcript_8166:225-596(+)